MADRDGYTQESVGQTAEVKDTPEQAADKVVVEEMKDNFAFVESYEDVQRIAESEELYFEGVDMWETLARDARSEHEDDDTGMHIPAKPTISVPLLDQNIQQIVNEARQARLALNVKPKTGLALSTTGGYIKGLVRSIQVESGALEVRIWALERTSKVGRGGWRIVADFATDDDFDIHLREERILDYSTVYWDPYSQRADRSDAEWCIVKEWMSEAERLRRWKAKPLIELEDAFTSKSDAWFAAADEETKQSRRVAVATYYKVTRTKRTLGFHPQFGRGWIGEAPENTVVPVMPEQLAAAVVAKAEGTRIREVDERGVQIYVADGAQILEKHPWHGRYIPVVELIGKEYYVKGKRRFKGIIANAMDLLRSINVLISSATEIAGTMPRAPYIMYEGQDEGLEDEWDDAPVKNFTRLHVKSMDVDGKPAPLPQRQQTELQVNGLLVLLRMMHEMYHAVTGSVAPQMRAVNPYDRSGKAIEALQRQGAAGTSNYLDNMATISMLYEGRVLLDAIPNYYDREGRVLYVVGEENDDDIGIMLKRPFIRGKDGKPEAVPCPACKGEGVQRQGGSSWNPFSQPVELECPACKGSTFATKANMPQVWKDKEVEYVDLGDGEYKVVAGVDRDFQTRQDEAMQGMTSLAQAAPELVPVYADLWVRAMAFSGSNEIADRIKSRMPEGDDALKDIPPQLLGKFMQLKQQHQQAMQALEQAQKMLDSDAMKAAGQKEIAMIKGALQGKVETMKAQTRMLEVKATAGADERLEVLRGQIKGMQQEALERHEVMLKQMDQRQEIVVQLLKELGQKEVERHSVGLHNAAAERAAEIADLHEERGAVRDNAVATAADHRKEAAATRADARSDTLAARDHARGESSAEADHARSEVSAERQAERDAAAQKATEE